MRSSVLVNLTVQVICHPVSRLYLHASKITDSDLRVSSVHVRDLTPPAAFCLNTTSGAFAFKRMPTSSSSATNIARCSSDFVASTCLSVTILLYDRRCSLITMMRSAVRATATTCFPRPRPAGQQRSMTLAAHPSQRPAQYPADREAES